MLKENEQQRIDELINRKLSEKSRKIRPMDELEWLQYKRAQTKREIDKSKERLVSGMHSLTGHEAGPMTRMGKFMYMLDRGTTLIQGLKMGMQIGNTIRLALGIKKLFKKKK